MGFSCCAVLCFADEDVSKGVALRFDVGGKCGCVAVGACVAHSGKRERSRRVMSLRDAHWVYS